MRKPLDPRYDPDTNTMYVPTKPKPQPKTKSARAALAKRREAAIRKRADLYAAIGNPAFHRGVAKRNAAAKAGQMDFDDVFRPRNSGKVGAFFISGLHSFSGGIDDLWLMGREGSESVGGGGGGRFSQSPRKK